MKRGVNVANEALPDYYDSQIHIAKPRRTNPLQHRR